MLTIAGAAGIHSVNSVAHKLDIAMVDSLELAFALAFSFALRRISATSRLNDLKTGMDTVVSIDPK